MHNCRSHFSSRHSTVSCSDRPLPSLAEQNHLITSDEATQLHTAVTAYYKIKASHHWSGTRIQNDASVCSHRVTNGSVAQLGFIIEVSRVKGEDP